MQENVFPSGYPPVLVRSEEAEVLAPIGHRLLADGPATAGALSSHRVQLPAGADGAVPHRHEASSELFFVVDGVLEVLIGDTVESGRAGDLIIIPPGLPHAFAAGAGHGADALIVITPGIERFEYFRHVVRQRSGEQEPEVLRALQDRFDTHFVHSDVWTSARS